jgi:hypothetical protein
MKQRDRRVVEMAHVDKIAKPKQVVVGCHKMHIFTTNIPIFHSRYKR